MRVKGCVRNDRIVALKANVRWWGLLLINIIGSVILKKDARASVWVPRDPLPGCSRYPGPFEQMALTR